MALYRKKPVVIQAVQVTAETRHFVAEWCDGVALSPECTEWMEGHKVMTIQTLEGLMYAEDGDMIIKGVKGEFYPCRGDIFNETYELVDDIETVVEYHEGASC